MFFFPQKYILTTILWESISYARQYYTIIWNSRFRKIVAVIFSVGVFLLYTICSEFKGPFLITNSDREKCPPCALWVLCDLASSRALVNTCPLLLITMTPGQKWPSASHLLPLRLEFLQIKASCVCWVEWGNECLKGHYGICIIHLFIFIYLFVYLFIFCLLFISWLHFLTRHSTTKIENIKASL